MTPFRRGALWGAAILSLISLSLGSVWAVSSLRTASFQEPVRRSLTLDQVSPVVVSVRLADDAGVQSPIFTYLPRRPLTLVIDFDGPIDTNRSRPRLIATPDNQPPQVVPGELTWINDRQAQLRIPAIERGRKGPFRIDLTNVWDQADLPVRTPLFSFDIAPAHVTVWRVHATGDYPAKVILERKEWLMPRGVSPDGRHIYLMRQANRGTGRPMVVPYLFDTTSGKLQGFGSVRADIVFDPVRWDLNQGRIWLGDIDRLTLDGRLDPANELLIPFGDRDEVVQVAASPDGRRIAAIVLPEPGAPYADLVLFHPQGDEHRRFPGVVGIQYSAINGRPIATLSWSPNSNFLAYSSFEGQSLRDGYIGLTRYYLLSLERVERGETPPSTLLAGPVKHPPSIQWSSNSHDVALGGVGVVDLKGKQLLPKEACCGLWSSDGKRYATGNIIYSVADGSSYGLPVPTGENKPELLGWSADGEWLYYGRVEPLSEPANR